MVRNDGLHSLDGDDPRRTRLNGGLVPDFDTIPTRAPADFVRGLDVDDLERTIEMEMQTQLACRKGPAFEDDLRSFVEKRRRSSRTSEPS